MKKLLSVLMIVLSLTSISQVVPNKDMVVQLFAGGSPLTGIASKIERVTGSIYSCGYVTTVSSGKDFVLAKLDSNLVTQWVVQYDYVGLDEKASDLCIDQATGDVYITGFSEQGSGNKDILTAKYNSSGSLQWMVRYNGNNNTNDEGNSIAFDGTNVWVAGYATIASKGKDGQILKLNGSSGATISTPKRNGTSNTDDVLEKVCIYGTRVFVTGYTSNTSTNKDVFTAAITLSTAVISWSTATNGSASGDDSGLDALVNNGDLYICGYTNNTTTGNDYYFARINIATGAVKYSNTYDGGFNGSDKATSMVSNKYGFYGVTGYITDGSSNNFYNTRMYDTSNVYWTHSQPVNGAYTSILPKISTDTIAYHYYISGAYYNSTLDGLLYQVDPTGVKRWTEYHNGVNNARDGFVSLVVDGLARIFVASPNETGTSTGIYDYKMIRYSQTPLYWPPDLNNDSSSLSYEYIPNVGQLLDYSVTAVPEIKYYTPSQNPRIFIEPTKNYFVYTHGDTIQSTNDSIERIEMDFINPNIWSVINPQVETEGYLNFFLSHLDSGRTGIKGYKRLFVPNIWAGIDLHYYSSLDGIKYYLVLKQGWANIEDVQFRFDGQTSDNIVNHELIIDGVLDVLKFNRPKVYQVDTTLAIITSGTGNWKNISASDYGIDSLTNVVGTWPIILELETNRTALSMAACPTGLSWSTFFSDGQPDEIRVSNTNGNQYVTGWTNDPLFPKVNAFQTAPYGSSNFADAFILKFNNNNIRSWATYYGTTGSNQYKANDYGTGIDVDSLGNVYVCGYTFSDSIPTWKSSTGGAFFQSKMKTGISTNNNSDMFILKMDSSGCFGKPHVTWCSYLGGFNSESASDLRFRFGYLYVVGNGGTRDYATPANSLPLQNKTGAYKQDSIGTCHIHKFSSNCVYDWGTFYNKATSTAGASIYSCDISDQGQFHITGSAKVTSIPTTAAGANLGFGGGTTDAYWTMFNADSVYYSTYLGGDGDDAGQDIVAKSYVTTLLKPTKNISTSTFPVYISGYSGTYSVKRFPIKFAPGEYVDSVLTGATDAIISKFDGGTGLLNWSTYFGKNNKQYGTSICMDTKDNIFIHGQTLDSIPIPSPNASGLYYQNNNIGFIASFAPNNTYGWGTYWGGYLFTTPTSCAAYQDKSLYIIGQGIYNASYPSMFPLCAGTTGGYYSTNDAMYIARFDITTLYIGIKEVGSLEETNDILVYPNPSQSSITVKMKESKNSRKLEIYNMLGQMIYSSKITEEKTEINVSQYRDGLYVIKLIEGDKLYTGKFVKQ